MSEGEALRVTTASGATCVYAMMLMSKRLGQLRAGKALGLRCLHAAKAPAGDLWMWGMSDDTSQFAPAHVVEVGKVTHVSCGLFHWAAISTQGKLFTCGRADGGRLGRQEEDVAVTPACRSYSQQAGEVNLHGFAAAAVSAGGLHSLVVLAGGDLLAFGFGSWGQLGLGLSRGMQNLDRALTPKWVKGLSDVRSVSAGGAHSAAIDGSGRLYTWGRNENGRLGYASDELVQNVPREVEVGEGTKFKLVRASAYQTLAVSSDELWSWGSGSNGELGLGERRTAFTPQRVQSLAGEEIVELAAGAFHVAVVTAKGDLLVWGGGADGQLGLGQEVTSALLPARVCGLPRMRSVACEGRAVGEGGQGCVLGAASDGRSARTSERDQCGRYKNSSDLGVIRARAPARAQAPARARAGARARAQARAQAQARAGWRGGLRVLHASQSFQPFEKSGRHFSPD
eukprot:762951-Hanusia_phi.AAC.1